MSIVLTDAFQGAFTYFMRVYQVMLYLEVKYRKMSDLMRSEHPFPFEN